MRFAKHKKGFTIMDVLISAAIVSLLSSLFLFRVSEAKKKAEDGQMKVQAHEVSNAIALYKNDNGGRAPLSTTGGGVGTPGVMHAENNPDSDYLPTMQTLVDNGYLSKIPTSPDGSSYFYGVSEDYEDAVFLADLNNPLSSNLSSGDSCQFLPEESSQPLFCTTIPAQPATCSVVPAVTQTYCPEVGSCYTVLVSATTTSCTPEVPAQTICPDSGPQFQASLCDGSDENNLCQCI
jgi:type II secretory pathway pseudopilin PulG